MVKFSEKLDSPVSQRWRDLLLAEHLALSTLRQAGVAAAASAVIDHEGQRFLEVQRFDRVGTLGRIVSPLGVPVDTAGGELNINTSPVDSSHRLYYTGDVQLGYRRPVEVEAPGIIGRKSVGSPLLTGVSCVDAMVWGAGGWPLCGGRLRAAAPLRSSALALPAGFLPTGLPWGITLFAPDRKSVV